ncbi:MAG: DUF721 domain-containing protein, partial [Acidobacteria bacterium]|nr:DUF721 domain-containing protein [Acidobacteriota bacterium]
MAGFVNGVLAEAMQPVRDFLPANLWEQMQAELGPEETLRLLWPLAVGARLAANTRLRAVRGKTLLVAVPDRTWKESLRPLEKLILETVNRFWKKPAWEAIEFRESPRSFPSPPAKAPPPRVAKARHTPTEQFAVDMIADTELRKRFLESARKYFARQEE